MCLHGGGIANNPNRSLRKIKIHIYVQKKKETEKRKEGGVGRGKIAEIQVGFHQKVGRSGYMDPLDGSHAFDVMR